MTRKESLSHLGAMFKERTSTKSVGTHLCCPITGSRDAFMLSDYSRKSKYNSSKKAIYLSGISLLMVLFLFAISGCFTSYGEDDITELQINNRTDTIFSYIRIRETGSTYWAISRFGTYDTGRHTIELLYRETLDKNKRYDIQLSTLLDGITATKSNVSLTQNGTVAFLASDFDDDTSNEIRTIHIFNRTGIDFYNVAIGIVGSNSYVVDIKADIFNGRTLTISNIDPPLDVSTLYEIELYQYPTHGISAVKKNVILSQNHTVRFEPEDLN